MGRLRILARGDSTQAQAQARGKLFEDLMSKVLRQHGYSIDRVHGVNYAGMEIDIEGRATVTQVPLYAQCKCYETEVDSPRLQAFFGNYMTRWFRDQRSHGLFIALPAINSHAKGYYRENCEGNPRITVRLLEEDEVLGALFATELVARPETLSRSISAELGTPGEWVLLYTDKGLFWVQYVIPCGGAIPSRIVLFDCRGQPLSQKETIDYLTGLWPELADFDIIPLGRAPSIEASMPPQDIEKVVEVKGSSSCFEYQFPASPEHFVGRQHILREVSSFAEAVINKTTSSRGILFEGNSGWGKSSVVLAAVANLIASGHFAVAIDSRSASSSQFILRVVEYVFNKFGDFRGILPQDDRPRTVTGFEGAVDALVKVGKALETDGKVLVIFLDQFENLFFLPGALKSIRNLFIRVYDARTNIAVGFSWKSDLIGLTGEFPYKLRDSITELSKHVYLDTFSEVETNALLARLREELRAPLRSDLRFLLSEFSQGYPWLLKRLCAHVTAQREKGISQSEIADGLLNIEELFQEDLRGLTAAQDDALRRIAKAAPVSVLELGEQFDPDVVQTLVHRRLVVSIGNKYDVYWDIFRDYLNSGRVPVQENYMLRVQVGSVLKAARLLAQSGGRLSIRDFERQASLSAKSFFNIARQLRLLGLAKVDDGQLITQISLAGDGAQFEDSLRVHLKDRLKRNRLVWKVLRTFEGKDTLTLAQVADTLRGSCPYISATPKTWRGYAVILCTWLDFTDLAIFDSSAGTVSSYKPGVQVRERRFTRGRRKGNMLFPCIQYSPVERAAERIVEAIRKDIKVDWTGFRRSTIYKAVATLEYLGFVTERLQSIEMLPKGLEFVLKPERRPALFAEGASKMQSFRTFLDILSIHKDKGRTLTELALELTSKLRLNWKQETGKTYVKIMLDWARHANLAPGVFSKKLRRKKTRGVNLFGQASLFTDDPV